MKQTTVLYRTYETALAARKAYADAAASGKGIDRLPWFTPAEMSGHGTLGCDITTPTAHLADLWELWGDGRRLVSDAERSLLLADLLRDHARFPFSVDSARLFSRFIGYQAGVPLFEEMVAAPDGERAERYGLKEAENDVFALVRAYYERLALTEAVESGCAAAALAETAPLEEVIVAERLDAIPALQAFIEGARRCLVMKDDAVISAEGDRESLFSFPAGAGAVAQSVLAHIEDEPSCGHRVLVACADPHDMFARCAPMLARRGYETALVRSVSFDETAFGRAVRSVEAIMEGDAHAVQLATDFAYGVFSGMTAAEARKLNARLRENRALGAEGAYSLVREASPSFAAIESLLQRTDDAEAERTLLLDALGSASFLTADDRATEERMLDAYIALRSRARALGIDVAVVREQARGLRVPLSLASSGYDPCAASVRFVGLDALERLAPDEFDTVVLVDLTDDEIDTASSHSTLDALAHRIGLPPYPSQVERLRNGFEHARRAAKGVFVCVMPLRDRAFEPTYPAFTLDEYVSALADREGMAADPRDDDWFRFPKSLVEAAMKLGEDDLLSAIGGRFGATEGTVALDPVVRGTLKHANMMTSLKTVDEAGSPLPILSPSAIEAYLHCPYRWFATSRLRLSALDETFSVREMGDFAHRAFAETYTRLAGEGIVRIDKGVLDRAQTLLDETMDDVLAEYEATRGMAFDAGSVPDRLLPLTPAERLEVASLREDLHGALALMADLPSGFAVFGHEVDISPEDGIDFAGVRLNGRIDRIDVSTHDDRFVVIDYKGSLRGHAAGWAEELAEEDFALPAKVQALIYAIAFQRLHGGRPAAAVYASYRAGEGDDLLAGSFDPVAYGASEIASAPSAVWRDFASFLDLLEERIAPAMDALKRGIIACAPSDADACLYCPLADCEGRR